MMRRLERWQQARTFVRDVGALAGLILAFVRNAAEQAESLRALAGLDWPDRLPLVTTGHSRSQNGVLRPPMPVVHLSRRSAWIAGSSSAMAHRHARLPAGHPRFGPSKAWM